jgi:hypothetical protein
MMRRIGGMPTILPADPTGAKDRYPYISATLDPIARTLDACPGAQRSVPDQSAQCRVLKQAGVRARLQTVGSRKAKRGRVVVQFKA